MSRKGRKGSRKSSSRAFLQKANGKIDKRVQQVGPERFGIVTVDCAKARSKWMLCDFYGNVLLPPAEVEHDRNSLQQALAQLKQAEKKHRLKHVLVAVERTGNYHLVPVRSFDDAGYETRVIHPFATKQFRQVASPSVKTDDIDLAAMHRATVVGFALVEEPLGPLWRKLRLWVRHRRDLVNKNSALRCQMREHLHLAMPGYATLFKKRFWQSTIAMPLARYFGSPTNVRQAGVEGLAQRLREEHIRFQHRSLTAIVAWAQTAAKEDQDAALHIRILRELHDDLLGKTRQIRALEREILSLLVQTPYVLLLAIPGIHVVSAAEWAGEMGPIDRYANPNCITGRAGLFPGRYQSDETDNKLPMVRCGNKRLRAALMQIADNLLKCNDYFQGLAAVWNAREVDKRLQRVRIVKRFSRLAYAMVAGEQVFAHPCCQKPAYILDKLLELQLELAVPFEEIRANMLEATNQLPNNIQRREAEPLQQIVNEIEQGKRRNGVKHISEALLIVLAKLLGEPVESLTEEGASN